MPIELSSETILTLSQAAQRLPPSRRGRPVSLSCVYRWVFRGVRTPARIVRLEAIKLGGRYLTSVEALQRFADRKTTALDDPPHHPRTSAGCRQASEQTDPQLTELAI